MKGVISPKGWLHEILEGVRLGVIGERKSAFAAEEKKSPVVSGCRSGVIGFVGVLSNW